MTVFDRKRIASVPVTLPVTEFSRVIWAAQIENMYFCPNIANNWQRLCHFIAAANAAHKPSGQNPS